MNGLVERANRGILRSLRIAKSQKTDWREEIKKYVYSYNTAPHTITGKAPLELLTNRPVKDLLPSLRTEPFWNRDEATKDEDACWNGCYCWYGLIDSGLLMFELFEHL